MLEHVGVGDIGNRIDADVRLQPCDELGVALLQVGVGVHRIHAQTVEPRAALHFGDALAPQPLGYFHPLHGEYREAKVPGGACQADRDEFLDGKYVNAMFAEIYWADLPRLAVKDDFGNTAEVLAAEGKVG